MIFLPVYLTNFNEGLQEWVINQQKESVHQNRGQIDQHKSCKT